MEYLADNLTDLLSLCGETTLISVNVPDMPLSEVKGVRACSLGMHRLFRDKFEQITDNVWKIFGDRQPIDGNDGTDVPLLEEGYVTITPVSILRADTQAIDRCKKLENKGGRNRRRTVGNDGGNSGKRERRGCYAV